MSFYKLSNQADQDLDEIFTYTEEKFGFEQAVKYISQFETLFASLINNPGLGKKRDEIKLRLRSFPKAEHVVFYRILEDHIRIIRVLHGSRDIQNFLE